MAIVQLRIDDELKLQAASVYEKLGIDLSSAIRMFLKRSVMVNGIPFSMILDENAYNPEAATAAMKRMNESARKNGTSEMSLDEINSEIAAYRKELSANTLSMMDSSIKNLKEGKVSDPVDLPGSQEN